MACHLPADQARPILRRLTSGQASDGPAPGNALMKTNACLDPDLPPPAPALVADALLDRQGLDTYQAALTAAIGMVTRQWSSLQAPCHGISRPSLQAMIDRVDLDSPLGDLQAAMHEAGGLYLHEAMYFHHPHYLAHLNCPVLVAPLAAEAILSAVNSSMDTWDQSLGASLIEQKLMHWTANRCGLPPAQADGVMTSGGSQSNLMAMLLARDMAAARLEPRAPVRRHGLPESFRRMRILAADTTHFSIHKAAALLGLGERAVIEIATDDQGRLTPVAVEQALAHCRARDWIPIVLAATAGTTDMGSIDPLPELADICRRHALRLHVDAAYGGGLLASPRHRQRLAGIEAADSITIDYHKSWFQPVSCSAFLVRERRDWEWLTWHADYLNPASQIRPGCPNLVDKSLQTTRRFDAFKLWLSLRGPGPEAIGQLFDQVIELAGHCHQWLRQQDDIQLATSQPPMLSTLLFRYCPAGMHDEAAIDRLNQRIREALLASGEAVLGGTRRRRRHYLKFTLLNPRTTLADLQQILTLIRHHAGNLSTNDQPLAAGPPDA